MPFLFSKDFDAIKNALNNRSFGACYSEIPENDLNVHTHDCCEVFLCLSGGSTFLIDGEIYDVSDGDLFVINQFEPHKIIPKPDAIFARFALQIHPEYLAINSTKETDLSYCFYTRGENFSNKITLNDKEITEIEQLFILFRTNNIYGDDILKNAAVNTLLVLVNQYFQKQSKDTMINEKKSDAMYQTIQYVNHHFYENITLDILAKRSYISVNQLCKLFKKQFGTTVAKYVMSKRICEAKKMLAQGKNVSETAVSCGFSDYANFIRVFKKFVGVSPGKYTKI